MSQWYRKVQGNLAELVNCIDFYEAELDAARVETSLKGNTERHSRDMPGIVEYRFNQLQEIEAILEYLNIEKRRLRSKTFRNYLRLKELLGLKIFLKILRNISFKL